MMTDTIIAVPIADVRVDERRRLELGDIPGLAASIAAVGLLHPVILTADRHLVAGERRLRAYQQLGREEIPARVVDDLDTALKLLQAERDENICRKDLAPEEMVTLKRRLEPLEVEAAKDRQREHGGTAPGQPRNTPAESAGVKGGDVRARIAAAAGASHFTLKRAEEVVVAAEADPKLRPLVDEMNRTGKVNGVYRKLKRFRQAEDIAREPPPLPQGPFRVLVIDPPWTYGMRPDDPSHRAALPYPSLSQDELKGLNVRNLAHEDAVLWLWTTNAHMRDAFELLEAWTFEHKTILTWVKNRMGTGDWLRGQSEHCLLAVRGKPVVMLSNQTTVLEAPMGRHSEKPEAFYALVETLCPGSKVELFARRTRAGWSAHGDEVRACEGATS